MRAAALERPRTSVAAPVLSYLRINLESAWLVIADTVGSRLSDEHSHNAAPDDFLIDAHAHAHAHAHAAWQACEGLAESTKRAFCPATGCTQLFADCLRSLR